jgi:uncharacterized BrkB/YihY/UPF0761 family membrane protein
MIANHSNAIKRVGIIVLLVSLAAAIGFGFLLGNNIAIPSEYSSLVNTYKFVYNWTVCATVGITGILFSLVFFALYHLTSAVEETRQAIAISADRIIEKGEKKE